MKIELTTKLIATLERDHLPPRRDADVFFWDTKTGGFGLRVRRRAGVVTKTWLVQRKKNRRCYRITFGSTDIITIDAARKKAVRELAAIALGEDPAADRRATAAKNERKLSALVAQYLEGKKRGVRAKTLAEVSRYLQGDYFKSLHNVPVHEIDRGRVSRCIEAVERERGAPTAREARQCLSGFFSWAMQMAEAPANPVIGSWKPPTIKPRDHVLADGELSAIWRACNGDDAGRVIRLLILTGCRRSEVGGMAWSELDLERDTWTIPASRSKNGREHKLPVMPAMRSIIETVPHVAGRDQLFGVRHALGFSLWNESKKALNQRLGDSVRPWRLHDIRRSVATGMAKLGTLPHVIECVLNHQSGFRSGVGGVYNLNPYEREVRAALGLWEDHIRSLVQGGRVQAEDRLTL
jgi:integrase